MNRDLRPIPLSEVLPLRGGQAYITMSEDQWDFIHSVAYKAGFILLELDRSERVVKAYQRKEAA